MSTDAITAINQEGLKQAVTKVIKFNIAVLNFHKLSSAKKVAVCYRNSIMKEETKNAELISQFIGIQ